MLSCMYMGHVKQLHLGGRYAHLIEQDGTCHIPNLLLSVSAATCSTSSGPTCYSQAMSCQAMPCRRRNQVMNGLLLCWYQVSGLLVPEFHLIPQHVDVEQLPHVLLSVILCRKQYIGASRPGRLQECTLEDNAEIRGWMAPVIVLLDANFFRIFPSSLSTLAFSCSLFWQFLMSAMKTCDASKIVGFRSDNHF